MLRSMKASRLSAVWFCFWIAGCGGGCGGALETGEGQPPPEQTPTDQAAESPADEPPVSAEPVDPGPRPVLRVVGEPAPHERTVAIRIENRGSEPVELAGTIGLQRQEGSTFEDVSANLDLRFSCEERAPECVTLAPGAAYLPPPWLARLGDAQCECDECAVAPGGTYRFVIRSCNGAHTIEGQAFESAED